MRNTKSIYAVASEGRLAQVYDAEGWHLDFPAEACASKVKFDASSLLRN